jgi:hypothetical protein
MFSVVEFWGEGGYESKRKTISDLEVGSERVIEEVNMIKIHYIHL